MSNDPEQLRTKQYRDSSNLRSRFNLHERYSVNKTGWHRWVFAEMRLADGTDVLELGCGPGLLWTANREYIPAFASLVISDFSEGMVAEAESAIGTLPNASYRLIDAEAIPLDDGSCDMVIANHMLYHVQDHPKAFSELHRVLRPGGTLFAATNGANHLAELDALVSEVSAHHERDTTAMRFGLENGPDLLRALFTDIHVTQYEDALIVTESEPLVDYVRSMNSLNLDEADLGLVAEEAARRIVRDGSIHITKDSGLITAARRD